MTPYRDSATYWTTPYLGGQLVKATFRQQRFCRHWHDTYVVALILGGAQGYWYRGARCVARAGTVVVISPGEVHTGESGARQGWAYRAFYPSAAWLRGIADAYTGGAVGTLSFSDEPIADPDLFGNLLSAHRLLESDRDALEAETVLYSVFAALAARYAQTRMPPASIPVDKMRVSRMQQLLGADLTETVCLSALAECVGLSPFYAARLFTKVVGIPPHAWRNQLRVERAVGLLRAGTPVTDAAVSVGFYDQSHLTRYVRRAYGVPPGDLAAQRL